MAFYSSSDSKFFNNRNLSIILRKIKILSPIGKVLGSCHKTPFLARAGQNIQEAEALQPTCVDCGQGKITERARPQKKAPGLQPMGGWQTQGPILKKATACLWCSYRHVWGKAKSGPRHSYKKKPPVCGLTGGLEWEGGTTKHWKTSCLAEKAAYLLLPSTCLL